MLISTVGEPGELSLDVHQIVHRHTQLNNATTPSPPPILCL